jgi:hypothetical protein
LMNWKWSIKKMMNWKWSIKKNLMRKMNKLF